ncbi:SWI SNF, matrix associated, actin dependent regulator of chromatin, sub d, member 3 [Blyttiomyces sp. JEL0837]|nr:SWI SNF, matrix associated, actin dependent regulator of chromatin, sub d, member 3 [Blyttiomyces sp. JEL0837]
MNWNPTAAAGTPRPPSHPHPHPSSSAPVQQPGANAGAMLPMNPMAGNANNSMQMFQMPPSSGSQNPMQRPPPAFQMQQSFPGGTPGGFPAQQQQQMAGAGAPSFQGPPPPAPGGQMAPPPGGLKRSESQALGVKHLSKKRRPMDLSLPRRLEDFIPEARLYNELQTVEKNIDATIMRKRLDVQESLAKPIKTKRNLRIYVSNTASNQYRDGDPVPDVNITAVQPPSWTLKVQGKLMDPPKGLENSKLSKFLRAAVITLHRDTSVYPEGNIIEWRKTNSSPEFDVFEVKRNGDVEIKATIELYVDHGNDMFKVQPGLASLLDIHVGLRSHIMMALWQYIKVNALQDVEDKRYVNLNEPLLKIFRNPRVLFTQIPDLLMSQLLPPDPVKIEYTIKLDKDATNPETAYDIPIDIEDPESSRVSRILNGGDVGMQRQILEIDEMISELVAGVHEAKLKREFMVNFARDPVNFVKKWVASQSRDLEVILGDSRVNLEEARRSSFYSGDWVSEAVFQYLQSKGR